MGFVAFWKCEVCETMTPAAKMWDAEDFPPDKWIVIYIYPDIKTRLVFDKAECVSLFFSKDQ